MGSKDNDKLYRITAFVTPEERKAIKVAAIDKDESQQAWIHSAICEKLEKERQ